MKNSVDFWWQIFFHIFPRKNGLKFVTPQTSKIFTTFSTARKEIYHLELALGATSRNGFSGLVNAQLLLQPLLRSSKHLRWAGDAAAYADSRPPNLLKRHCRNITVWCIGIRERSFHLSRPDPHEVQAHLFKSRLTVRFLCGASAETICFVTSTSGKITNIFVPGRKTKVCCAYPENQEIQVFGYPVLRSKHQRWIPEYQYRVPLKIFMGEDIGRTPKGAYSSRGRSRHLLATSFSEPLLRTLLRTLSYCKTHSRPPSQNPSENPFPRTLPRTFSGPFLERCLAVRPLRRAPKYNHWYE